MNIKSRYFKIVTGVSLALALAGGVLYFQQAPRGPIVDFVYDRDAQAVLKIFHADWDWLFPGPDYYPEYILKHRSPGEEPGRAAYRGKLKIKILRDNDKIAGFTTYYKENFYIGRIQFVAVASAFRKKGYGRLLTEYAIRQLFSLGCKKVVLLTRIKNVRARRLYERIGFKETGRDEEGGFINYAISPENFKE